MTKRQKRYGIGIYVVGFMYLFFSNHYILKFANYFREDNFWLFFGLYIISMLIMVAHSVLYGNWLVTFASNIIELPEDSKSILFRKKDKDFIKSKWLIRIKDYINEKDR